MWDLFGPVPNKWAAIWETPPALWQDKEKKTDVCWSLQEKQEWDAFQIGSEDPMAQTKKKRQAITNLYRLIDKGHKLGDCRAWNLHEGEGYLEIRSRSMWQKMPFTSILLKQPF